MAKGKTKKADFKARPMTREEVEACTKYDRFMISVRVGDLFKQTATLKQIRGARLKLILDEGSGDMCSFENIDRDYALMPPGRGPVEWVSLNRVYQIDNVLGG